MFPPALDSLFELISGAIAIVISLEAARARSFSKENVFLSFEISFALLGAASVLRAFLVLFVLFTARAPVLVRPVSALGDLIQACVGAVAYLILIWVQISGSWSEVKVLPQVGFAIVLLSFNVLNVFILVALATLVLVRYLRDRISNQALVSLGFFLLACAHLFNVFGYRNDLFFAIENVVRLAGYVSLLIMLTRVRRAS